MTIVKQADGTHVCQVNGVEFLMYAIGAPTADNAPRNETAALVDSVMSGINHGVTAWQTIMTDAGLSIDPWVEEAAKPVVMGIVQNAWYSFFKGAIPEKVERKQADRVREYPTLLATIVERKRIAAERAERTKNGDLNAEQIAAKKLEKEQKAADKIASKSAREAEKAALKLLKDAERAIIGNRPPRTPRTAGTGSSVGRSPYVYKFIAMPTGEKIKPIYTLIGTALRDLASTTAVDIKTIIARVVADDPSFTAKNVSDNIWAMHKHGGWVDKQVAQSTIADVKPEPTPEVEPAPPAADEPTKNNKKKNKKGKK